MILFVYFHRQIGNELWKISTPELSLQFLAGNSSRGYATTVGAAASAFLYPGGREYSSAALDTVNNYLYVHGGEGDTYGTGKLVQHQHYLQSFLLIFLFFYVS